MDGADHFALRLPPSVIERADLVLKFQGLFKDRDLYNYEVGPWYPGAVWAQKIRARKLRYRAADLDKLRLSVPCLMLDLPEVRRPDAIIPDRDYEQIASQARPHVRPRLGRLAYLWDLARRKVGVAPAGYGELGQRTDSRCLQARRLSAKTWVTSR